MQYLASALWETDDFNGGTRVVPEREGSCRRDLA